MFYEQIYGTFRFLWSKHYGLNLFPPPMWTPFSNLETFEYLDSVEFPWAHAGSGLRIKCSTATLTWSGVEEVMCRQCVEITSVSAGHSTAIDTSDVRIY